MNVKTCTTILLIACTSLSTARLYAREPAATSATSMSTWSAEIGFGYVKTTGNTKTESVKGNAKAIKEYDHWRHTAVLETLKASDSDVTTAERYFLSWKSDYKFTKFGYWYVTASYDNDRFSGFDYRVSESAGYGRRLMDITNLSLDGEIGPGARQTKFENGSTEEEVTGRLAANLKWKISYTSEFSEELFSEIGEDATVSKSVTALKANINSNLAMKLSYTVKHTSSVPEGVKNTDTESVVTIVYNYK